MTRELLLRPPEPSDDDAVGALCLERHRHFGTDVERDVRNILGRPSWSEGDDVDVAADVRVAERGDELVGYAWIRPRKSNVFLELWAREAGADEALTDWVIATADERAVTKLTRMVVADPVAQSVLKTRGFEYDGSVLGMHRPVGAVGEVAWPEGIVVENRLESDRIVEAMYRIDQGSFADNENFAPMEITFFERIAKREDFRSDFAWFAFGEADSDAGFCVVSFIPQCGNVGYIEDIGVLPAFRRRGLARALLRHAMHALIAEGASRFALGTASSNRRALGLYFSEGFEITHEYRIWVRTTGRSSTAEAR